ncbi:hypothetical protein LX81_01416 [Palleronia aestuarii]|uniref:Uncharacterized protein n=1 Tax=Palleronia aestuarii TaxID=568105 RepID=A0A2W7Q7D0_9RHOB|nr:hypothetical protein [Palleronia aestuarii]PZX17689.1 hypothetical protein LX81_01416 [Palleronia aestuarii]
MERGLYQACHNALYRLSPEGYGDVPPTGVDPIDIERWKTSGYYSTPQVPEGHLLLKMGSMTEEHCSLTQALGDNVKISHFVNGELQGSTIVPPVYLLAPDTRLADLQ